MGQSKSNRDDDIPDFTKMPTTRSERQYEKAKKSEMKRKLKELEENSISPKFFSDVHFDFFTHAAENASKEENYGFLPEVCIHYILLFISPQDLFVTIQTCRLIHNLASTNLFWKEYYHNYFSVTSEETICSKKEKNWKKEFYQKFSSFSDLYFSKRFKRNVERNSGGGNQTSTINHFEESNIRLLVIGDKRESFMDEILLYYGRNEEEKKYQSYKKKMTVFREKGSNRSFSPYEVFINDSKPNKTSSSSRFSVVLREYDCDDTLSRLGFIYGCFLCFDIQNSYSFKKIQKIYTQLKTDKEFSYFFNQHSLFLLVGLFNTEKRYLKVKEREVKFEDAKKFADENKLLGYIECLSDQSVSLSMKKKKIGEVESNFFGSENFMLSFGVLLDGMLRKENSSCFSRRRR